LEGSVRKGGNRVRITAQLIDAATSNHIWADRYDGDLTDIFALQDEITKKVVAAIEPKLLEAEGILSQRRSPEDLGAWDMVMIQANALFWRLTKAETEAAINLLSGRPPRAIQTTQQRAFPPVRFLISSRRDQFRVSSLAQTPPSESTYVDVGRSDE
ncbi:MAG TPA: hypothetical protein VFC29_06495, partial [Candidatus Limnocylindrales bacterium]|nr:hypothetical protein [Candidatus Limnocylindrales bacterium]